VFDKNVPLPAPTSKWDFTTAEPGDSLPFVTKAEALRFGAAIRAYGRKAGRPWGTKIAPEKKGWRAWIVEKGAVSDISTILPDPAFATETNRPCAVLRPTSTETDDDLGLSVDLRRGEDLRIERQTAPQPIAAAEDLAPGQRRRRTAPPVHKGPDLSALVAQAAE